MESLVAVLNNNASLNNSYIMVCPPVRGDNPRVARGLSPVQTDKPWYNYYFIPP